MNTPVDELQMQAQQYIAARQFPEAKEVYTRICALAPNNVLAWNALGILSGQLGDYPQAERAFRQFVALAPDNLQAHLNLGKVLESQNRFDDAELSYRMASENDPSGEALMALGTLLGRCTRFDEAAGCFLSVLHKQPQNAMAHFSLAAALEGQGDTEDALSHYRSAVSIQPSLASAHNSLGVLLQKLGNTDAAMQAYQAALGVNSAYATAYYNLGTCLNDVCRYSEACTQLQNALNIKNDFVEARLALGLALEGLGNKQAAIDCYQHILDHDPDNIPALTNLALVLQVKGQSEAAIALYEKVLSIAPDTVEAVCGLAGIREISGDYPGAAQHLDPLLRKGCTDVALALAFGSISSKLERRDQAISLLDQALSTPGLPQGKRSKIHYLLSKLHDEGRAYDEAFKHMLAANTIEAQRYDATQQEAEARKWRSICSAENLARLPRSACMSEQPVFIVGMPRSGTTLVEQILASHPDVHGAGELSYLYDIFRQLNHDAGDDRDALSVHLQQLSQEQLDSLAQQYLEAVWQQAPRDKKRITDKMPHNFQLVGLIEQLFPCARVIHCVRDPMDTCLSIFATAFNASHPYATDLGALGHYYRHYYEPIMEHWKAVCTLPILDLHYETLIDDQETVTRQLLDFCGLDWYEGCLRFHTTQRAVSTPSKNQVRQPLYRGAIQRWRHYAHQLQPLREALDLTADADLP